MRRSVGPVDNEDLRVRGVPRTYLALWITILPPPST